MTIPQSRLRRFALSGFILGLLLATCCARYSTNGNSNALPAHGNTTTGSTASDRSGTAAAAEQQRSNREPSLVSLSAGAFPVKTPPESAMYPNNTVLELMDERAKSDWRSLSGEIGPQVFVFALPERTVLKTLEFDCAEDLFAHDGA